MRYCTEDLKHPRERVTREVFQHAREALVRAMNATRDLMAARDPSGMGAGRFEMFGTDYILTDRLRVFMTEIQMGPGLSLDNPVKAKVLYPALSGAANLAFEVLERRRARRSLAQLDGVTGSGYAWLVNEARDPPYYFSVDGCARGRDRNPLCGWTGERP